MDSAGWTWSRLFVAMAALRVMVVQRFRISSVLGRLGTLGVTNAMLLSLDPADPELCELRLESRRTGRLRSGLFLPLELAKGWTSSATPLRLEVDSLSEEERLNSLLVKFRLLPDCVGGSERTSKERALWRRPAVAPRAAAAKRSCRPCSSARPVGVDGLRSARFRLELYMLICRLWRPARGLLYGCRYMEGMYPTLPLNLQRGWSQMLILNLNYSFLRDDFEV